MPMQRERYPENWEQISEYIRFERAGNKCEWCGAPNGQLIYRNPDRPEEYTIVPDPISQDEVYRIFGGKPISELGKVVRVILTVAHLGVPHDDGRPGDKHDKLDIRPENLAALCQRCHLLYDLPDHIANRRRTMARRKLEAIKAAGQQELF